MEAGGEEPAESNSPATTLEEPAPVPDVSRPKRVRTPGQIASFEKATQALKAKIDDRRAEKKKRRGAAMIEKIRARYSLDAPDPPDPPAVPAAPGPITAPAPEPPRPRARRRPRSTPPPAVELTGPAEPNPPLPGVPDYPYAVGGVGVRRHVFKFY
jgi:hypothetical protein